MLFCRLVQRMAPTHFVQRQGLPSITDTAFICEGEWKVLTAGWKVQKSQVGGCEVLHNCFTYQQSTLSL